MAYKKISIWMRWMVGASLFLCAPMSVWAAQTEGSLLSVTGEAQIRPIEDGSDKYMLKSDGFYCLKEDGSKDASPAVHYFQRFEIDGTVFDGYYYHDESGKFAAGSPRAAELKELSAPAESGKPEGEVSFNGIYMVGNLGKLNTAPQVRYIDQLKLGNVTYDGFFYFDQMGRMVTEPGIHKLSMECRGISFEGSYYFGGENGALLQEKGMTEDGFNLDKDGRVKNLDQLGIKNLREPVEKLFEEYQGIWSLYVKDLQEDEELTINNQSLYSASLIKAFVMAKTYEDLDEVIANQADRMGEKKGEEEETSAAREKVMELLYNMITVSDNESFNELVRLQTESYDFKDGAKNINDYLEKEGYRETTVQHTLAPSSSADVGIGGRNMTSVRDCGKLLDAIYQEECVSREASREMLELLLQQKVTTKIPQGIDGYVDIANKTGETETDQHDIAIVYGENSTYILCVMSENCPWAEAVKHIQDISSLTYQYMNLYEPEEEKEE